MNKIYHLEQVEWLTSFAQLRKSIIILVEIYFEFIFMSPQIITHHASKNFRLMNIFRTRRFGVTKRDQN